MLYEATYESPLGTLQIWAGERGILRIDFADSPNDGPIAWARRVLGAEALVLPASDQPLLRQAVRQLAEYFAGARHAFNLTLDLRGTPFQRAVWEALLCIPYGATRTYRQTAALIGRPAAVRAVGAANGANPISVVVPCHRLVGAAGDLRGYGGGIARKRALLELEGAWPPHREA